MVTIEGFTKKQLPKKGEGEGGASTVCRFKWSLVKKRGSCFWGRLIPQWTPCDFFTNPCDHGAVTRLENVCQLNKRRGKKILNLCWLLEKFLVVFGNINLRTLALEMYKVFKGLSPVLFNEIFPVQQQIWYNFRNTIYFNIHHCKTVN